MSNSLHAGNNSGSAWTSPYTTEPPPAPSLPSRSARHQRSGSNASKKPKKTGAAKGEDTKKRWPRRLGFTLLFLFLGSVIAGSGFFLWMYNRTSIPEPSEFALAQATTVYYADGETELGRFAEVNRTAVDLSTLPDYVAQAVIASEDRTFFTNAGVDLRGIARAFWNNVRGGKRQGASTLTQQYVDNYFGEDNPGYRGKLHEAFMALKINRTQSKDQILSNYLNTIYFGRGAYGIEAAAQAYFGVPAKDLTLSQSALLSGVIPAPSLYDPGVDEEAGRARWQRVLDLMVQDGWISQAEANQQVFPDVVEFHGANSSMTGWQGYLLQQIREELIATDSFTLQDLDEGGLKIVSTVDQELQKAAMESRSVLPEDTPDAVRLALTSINNATGEIVAEYPGSDYEKIQINAATQDVAQAGSTFKPFSLIPFLESGGSMSDVFDANSPIDFNGVVVQNAFNISYGDVTAATAVELSLNTAFVEINRITGPAKTEQSLIEAGIPADTGGLNDDLTNVLGQASPHNIDLAHAYSTLANGGYRVTPHMVSSVSDSKGNVVYQGPTQRLQVFNSDTISKMMPAMFSVFESGTAGNVGAMGRKVAGKTGTGEDFKSAQIVGFIPEITTAVSMYHVGPNGEELELPALGDTYSFYGQDWPNKVWVAYMKVVFDRYPQTDFPWYNQSLAENQAPSQPAAPDPAPAPAPSPEPGPAPAPTPDPEPDPGPGTDGGTDPGTGPTQSG